MIKRLFSVMLLLCFLCAALPAFCEVRPFTDDCGRQVELPDTVRSVVPSGALSQIVLYAIAPDLMTGLSTEMNKKAANLIPERFFKLPVIGQIYTSASINIEQLAWAAPDLIVDIGEAKKTTAQDMDSLYARTLIPSVHIEATLITMPDALRRLGAVLGRTEKAETLASFCEEIYAQAVEIMDRVGENKIRALYVMGTNGLSVLGKNSYHSALFDFLTDNLAVMDNPSAKGTGNSVTLEQIALWNPDFILFAQDSINASVSPIWSDLRAIQDGRFACVPSLPDNWMGMPPSVQQYLGLIWLPAVLYPEYATYDVKSEVSRYFSLFYGIELTDSEFDALTQNAFAQ